MFCDVIIFHVNYHFPSRATLQGLSIREKQHYGVKETMEGQWWQNSPVYDRLGVLHQLNLPLAPWA
jgi:hypothetical protein